MSKKISKAQKEFWKTLKEGVPQTQNVYTSFQQETLRILEGKKLGEMTVIVAGRQVGKSIMKNVKEFAK